MHLIHNILHVCFFTRFPDRNFRCWGFWYASIWKSHISCQASKNFNNMKGPEWSLKIQKFYPFRILVEFLNVKVQKSIQESHCIKKFKNPSSKNPKILEKKRPYKSLQRNACAWYIHSALQVTPPTPHASTHLLHFQKV